MSLTHQTDHVSAAINRLPEIYSKPRIQAWVRAFSSQIQELENAAFQMLLLLVVDSVGGVNLDRIGVLVGLKRSGRSDPEYRTWLGAWIRSNRSEGTGNDLLEVLRLIADNDLALREEFPAAALLVVADALSDEAYEVARVLYRAKMGGVRVQLEYGARDDDQAFIWSSGDSDEASTTQGWGDDTETTGGYWAGIEEASSDAEPSPTHWERMSVPTANGLIGVATDGLGKWLAVGFSGTILLSDDDGDTWLLQTPASAFASYFSAAARGAGVWCAVGDGEVQTSPDGSVWTERAFQSSLIALGLRFDDGFFVAVGADASDGELQYSEDGVSWSVGLEVPSVNLRGAAYSPTLDRWVTVGTAGTIRYATGTLTSWDTATPDASFSGTFYSVVWTSNRFIAVGDGEIQISADGITWTRVGAANGYTGGLRGVSVTAGGLTFAAGPSAEIQRSLDGGLTWESKPHPYDSSFAGILYNFATSPTYRMLVGTSGRVYRRKL